MVRVGVNLQREGLSYDFMKDMTQLSDALGFDSLWIFDHFMAHGRTPTKEDILECLVTLSALASDTKRLRLGALVLCNLFRHPALVAKMTASLDVISHGRLEVGLGIGGPSTPPELMAYGLSSFPKRGERIARLEESIMILKSMWTQQEATFDGKYYFVNGAINNPKPVQKPHPPIWIGGEADDIITLAAKHADGWNFRNLTYDAVAQNMRIMDSKCLEIGRDPGSVQRSWSGVVVIAKNQEELQRKLGDSSWRKGHLVQGLRPTTILGTPEECVERIQRYGDLGIDLMILNFPGVDSDTLTLFADHVLNNLS